MRQLRIAVIPGDGIGKEVIPEGIRVLDAVGRRFGVRFAVGRAPLGLRVLSRRHGRMMPEDGLAQIRRPRRHLPRRRGLARRARPRLAVGPADPDPPRLPAVRQRPPGAPVARACRCPLAGRQPGDIDFVIVRENNEGEYSAIGGRHVRGHRARDGGAGDASSPATGVDRIMRYAFELAAQRPRSTSPPPPSRTASSITMPYWDERFRAIAARVPRRQDRPVPHRHPHRPLRPQPALVRRRGGLQPLRRHPLRPRARRAPAPSASRPGANINPERRIPVHVRAGARLGPGHRGQGHRQPDRPDLGGRDDARAPRARRGGRGGAGRRGAGPGGRSPHADMGGKATTTELGKAIATEL